MAVSIGISVAQNSQDVEMNNSTVTIQVIAYFTAGSYNKTSPGPLLQLYVDGGLIDSCNVGFNTSQLTSGSELIYSNQFVVDHNSDGTRTLNVSAIYESGVSSGTVTASTSKELTKINTSSSGGSSDEGSGEENLHTITIQEGEHTSIVVWSAALEEALSNNSQISDGAELVIYFSADDGYELSTHTVNGVEFTSGKTYYIYEDIVVKTTAVVSSGSGGDSGNTGAGSTESGTVSSMYAASGSSKLGTWYSQTTSVVGYSGYHYTVYIEFTMPDYIGILEYIKFSLPIYAVKGSPTIGYAICSSYDNRNQYLSSASVSDTNQIISGTASGFSVGTCELTIETKELEGSKTYYLFLWDAANSNSNTITISPFNDIGFVISYSGGLIYIDNGTEFLPHQCYIDNGSSWDLYIPYIDSGSNWNMCT